MSNDKMVSVPHALLLKIEMTWRQADEFHEKANDAIAEGLRQLRTLLCPAPAVHETFADAIKHGTGVMLVSAEGAEHVPHSAFFKDCPPPSADEEAAFRAYLAADPMATYRSTWQARAVLAQEELATAKRANYNAEVALKAAYETQELWKGRTTNLTHTNADLQQRLTAAEQRIASLHHVGMELTGVIDEYRAMPCDSLAVRMFQTADRYRLRLTAKCQTCKDSGTVYKDFNEVEGRFSPEPCPDCAKPAESVATERAEDDRWLQMKDDAERADYIDEPGERNEQ